MLLEWQALVRERIVKMVLSGQSAKAVILYSAFGPLW